MASWHFPSDWTFRISPDIVDVVDMVDVYGCLKKEIFPRWTLRVLVQGRKGD